MIKIISIIFVAFGYIAISQEQLLRINKTAISLLLGVILWVLATLANANHVAVALSETSVEIFGLVIFLLSAMTLVEILTHYGLFDMIYRQLLRLKLNDRLQFFILSLLTFILSSFLDNLTTTIVFLQIAQRFFSGKNLIKAASAIVVAANAGGAFSPIGDVTTTMLWLAGKFDTQTILTQGFLPSITVFLVSTVLIGISVTNDTKDTTEPVVAIGKAEWLVIALCLGSFALPLIMTSLGLPPYLGLLLGLGIVWLSVDIIKHRVSPRTTLAESIEKFFQKTDIGSLYFFIGILLAVGALGYLGVMNDISKALYPAHASNETIIVGNVSIGILSSLLDNIPLTAAASKIVQTTDPSLWVLLALTVGVGGSILLIGSAPGIIAATIVKNMSFINYLKTASLPAMIAFFAGVGVWYAQYTLILLR